MSNKFTAAETSVVIVISEFNLPIIENLLQGALKAFTHHGGKESDISIYRVPGAFEIPGTIRQIMKFHKPEEIDVPRGTNVLQVIDCVGKVS